MSETPKAPTVVLTFNPATQIYSVLVNGLPVRCSRDPVAVLPVLRSESSK